MRKKRYFHAKIEYSRAAQRKLRWAARQNKKRYNRRQNENAAIGGKIKNAATDVFKDYVERRKVTTRISGRFHSRMGIELFPKPRLRTICVSPS